VSTPVPPGEAGLAASLLIAPNDLHLLEVHLETFMRPSVAAAGNRDLRIDAEVLEGNVAAEIARTAQDRGADLLVMGTHGRSGFERLMLGSVTEKMLRKAPCPMLTVPPQAGLPPAHVAPYRRILCAVDFSPSSLRALAFAESLAAEADAELVVMHVIEPASVFEPVPASGPGDARAVAKSAALEEVRRLITPDARTYSRVSEVVSEGRAYEQILHEAAARRSELIVLGAHRGHRGVPAFGSTPNHVVREATCPVLTARL
jgi:nucleotide-binding universal stress UspA family protein